MAFLLRRAMDPNAPPDTHENRTRIGMLAGWTSVVLSLLLCTIKGALGLLSGSISMMADATNNLTDVGSSLVIALGFKWSRKPSDEEHPFGHGRIEAVVTLLLAVALILVGTEVAKSGIIRLIAPQPIKASGWVLTAVGITVVIKLWMALFARKLARLSQSHVLEADAWNHTYDVASTLLVVVALLGARIGWTALDGWTAIAVALFILFTGVKYAREAIDILLGQLPDMEEIEAVERLVEQIDGVLGIHEIMIHQYGDVRMVSFHIEVPHDATAVEAHEIAQAAEIAVEEQLHWRTIVHADPIDRSSPLFEPLYQELKTLVKADADLVDFHDLRIEGSEPPFAVSVDLVVRTGTCRSSYDDISARCIQMLSEKFANRISTVELGIEALVDSSPMARKNFCLLPSAEK